LFNIEKILCMLPHRYPFLLVDKVLELEKGKSIVAVKNVTINEPFFQGHFPVIRVMPGVLVVEAMAQAGGILLYNSIPNPDEILVFLSKIDNMKFRKPVVPGDQIRLEVEIIKLKSRIGHVRGRALVDGAVVTEGEIWASLADLEALHE
jgi:3-hydroxyacyl-[acyl-carrier-protein] dehydratase/UDP-3-O-[3-hydroxymyristoyl] N-acetylglucosamine deacetylase/3-hydroxyacyl-[acyl-carrier-protein] dehydratase